jgi:hypothetical protein
MHCMMLISVTSTCSVLEISGRFGNVGKGSTKENLYPKALYMLVIYFSPGNGLPTTLAANLIPKVVSKGAVEFLGTPAWLCVNVGVFHFGSYRTFVVATVLSWGDILQTVSLRRNVLWTRVAVWAVLFCI